MHPFAAETAPDTNVLGSQGHVHPGSLGEGGRRDRRQRLGVLAKGQQEVKAQIESSRALKSFEIQGFEEVQSNLFGWVVFFGERCTQMAFMETIK